MAILGIVPERALSIVSIEADEIGLRLRYSVEPPFPQVRFDLPARSYDELGALQDWGYEVVDDCGTTYLSAGGARGRSDGVRTVAPPPPPAARELTIMLHPYMRDSPRYLIRVRVPRLAPWSVPASHLDVIEPEAQ